MTDEILTAIENSGVVIGKNAELSRMERMIVQRWGNTDTARIDGQCCICGITGLDPVPMPYDIFGESVIFKDTYPSVCEKCFSIVQEHDENKPEIAQTPLWDEECPYLYQNMQKGDIRPKYVHDESVYRVANWDWSSRGLILIGGSGTGKTLSMWLAFKKLEKDGKKPMFFTAVEISRYLSAHAKDLRAAKSLWKCSILMIDDLGKEKITPAASALFWELVDQRYGNRLPMIISTRFQGKAFTDRFAEPTLGEDIRRRLKDMSSVVLFKSQNETTNQGE